MNERLLRRARKIGAVAATAAVTAAIVTQINASADPPDPGEPFGWQVVSRSELNENTADYITETAGLPFYNAAYRKSGDDVQLRGVVTPTFTDGAPNEYPAIHMLDVWFDAEPNTFDNIGPYGWLLFTLPCGYLPARIYTEAVVLGDLGGRREYPGGIAVMPDGRVYASTLETPIRQAGGVLGYEMSVSLNGIEFTADNADNATCPSPTTTEASTTTSAPEETTVPEETTTTAP